MFGRAIIITLLCLAPYVHMVYTWSTGANVSGNFLLWSLILLFVSPLVLAIIAFAFIRSSIGVMRDGIAKHQPIKAGGGMAATTWLTWVIGSALVTMASVTAVFLTPSEPGRDRLGRNCEKSDSGTICRPDLGVDQPLDIDRATPELQRKQWFEKD